MINLNPLLSKFTKTFLGFTLMIGGLAQLSANNFVPEFTIDGVQKTFRVTSSENGDLTGTEVSAVEETDSGLLSTIVLSFSNANAGSITFTHIINETGIYDNGWTNSFNISRIPNEAYLELERVSTFEDTTVSSGILTLSNPFASDSTINQTTETTVHGDLETVTVEAGTFENVLRVTRVENQTVTTMGIQTSSEVTSRIWMANGVGLIKADTTTVSTTASVTETTTEGTELVSYSIPGNVPTGTPDLTAGGSGITLYDLDNLGDNANPASLFARPEGWHWTVGGYEWSDSGQFWYWIPPGPPQVANLDTGEVLPRPVNGWNYYNWPYFYNVNEGAWFYVFQANLPAVLNLSTNEWKRWGQRF